MLYIRSFIFYTGMFVLTLLFVPVSLLIFPFPFRTRYAVVSKWAIINISWLKITCDLDYIVEGKENIPEGPAIIMCKHQSAWETLILQKIFPPQCWILKRELLWIPIYGWGLASMNPIAIDRNSTIRSFRQIIKQGCERLADGIWVVVFPEGTRVPPRQKTKYLPGGGMLAEKSGYPVVPVAHNAGYFWPRRSFIKKPGTIRLVIGPPVESHGKSAIKITQEVESWIESTVDRLSLG